MINLVRADLYKETRKRSFKYIVFLIILVSILPIMVIERNVNLDSELSDIYPLFSEEDYLSVNKYGNYKQYVDDYDSYEEVVNNENELISRNSLTKSEYVLSYSQNFIFLFGVIVIVLSYHSFSYDYQHSSIRYLFMSKNGRKKIFFSKVISNFILMFAFLLLMIVLMLVTTMILTHENVFSIKTFVMDESGFKSVLFVLEYFKNSLVYIVPLFFISVLSMTLSILFKGSSLALVISGILYFSSLVFSQILFNYGFNFVKYTFLPYIDFTYLSDRVSVTFNNLIYNINISYVSSSLCLSVYSVLFILLSLRLLKRDV